MATATIQEETKPISARLVSQNGDTAQVGPGIAVQLDLPQVVFVRKIVEMWEGRLTAERITEEGFLQISMKKNSDRHWRSS